MSSSRVQSQLHLRSFWRNLTAAVLIIGAITLIALLFDCPSGKAQSFTQSTSDGSVFYRLKAAYLHGEERVDFDIVVGCAVRVTSYQDNSSSYDAFRDPVVYAKPTQDGGAVLQIVTDACRGETTKNGEVPPDFLPGAVWFDDKDDLSFGIAYVTEDAFENPQSKLTFRGATIVRATREEWEAFRPVAAKNLLDSKDFTYSPEPLAEAQVRANLWDRRKLAKWTRFSMECVGYQRHRLTDPKAREVVARYWPASHPRFWSPGYPALAQLNKEIGFYGTLELDGRPIVDYSQRGLHAEGFPTRARGGMLGSGKPWSQLPSPIFPMRGDDGVPWAHPGLETADTIYRDVDYDGGANLGFAYCYSRYFGYSAIGKLHLPNYFEREFKIRIDGTMIDLRGKPGASPADPPRYFFEQDEWLFAVFGFGLS